MFNPKGKSLSELIKETESKGIQVVLIGVDAEIGKHMALIEMMKMKETILLVSIADLPTEDQQKIQEELAMQKLCKPLEPEMFKLTPHPEILPDFVQDKAKPWESCRKRQKLKGYQKRK